MKENVSAINNTCDICDGKNWLKLPDPAKSHSVTTSGKIIPQPLGKSLCSECGFVQRNRFMYLGHSEYYQEEYASYYERPGTEEYHRKRYQGLLKWMSKYLPETFKLKTVLDVGCGQGWMMDAFSSGYHDIDIRGIEPSKHNANIARRKGHTIIENKIEHSDINETFDLVYSNNVLQHVNDISGFFNDMKMRLNDRGAIIVTCPDGSRPSIDLLWSDHNHSFLPQHLVNLGRKLGFERVFVTQSEGNNPSIPPAQLLLMSNNPVFSEADFKESLIPEKEINHYYESKVEYLQSFRNLNKFLAKRISGYSKVYNFGASYWTSVIAAYCPDYWNKVEACIIDASDSVNEFMGKKIVDLKSLSKTDQSIMVLGTAPNSHEWLEDKLQGHSEIIRWDNFFRY